MTCKIKFNNPILDELPTNFATYEEYHNQLVAKLDALYSYFNNDNSQMPEELDRHTFKVIMGLAELAGIPGFLSPKQRVGRPGLWKDEYGFKLSAHIQIFLLLNPDKTLHNAVTTVAKKYFSDKDTEGVYRRYLEEEQNLDSYVNLVKNIVHSYKVSYEGKITEGNKDLYIEGLRYVLNDRYKSLFPNSKDDLFKFSQNFKRLYIERIDLNEMFKN